MECNSFSNKIPFTYNKLRLRGSRKYCNSLTLSIKLADEAKIDWLYERKVIQSQNLQRVFDTKLPKLSWQEADEILARELHKVMGEGKEITHTERLMTQNIQFHVLNFISKYLIEEAPDPEIGERMTFYLHILLKHQAADLNIMADGLAHLKNYMDSNDYNHFKKYILEKAEKNVAFALAKFNEYNGAFKETLGSEKLKWYWQTKSLANLTEEAQYVRELLK